MIFSDTRIGKVSGDGEPGGDGVGGGVSGVNFLGVGGSGFEEVTGDGGNGGRWECGERGILGRIGWWF